MKIDLNYLHEEIIGSKTFFNTPYGKRLLTYADYTASGKTLNFIENYLKKIQEVYGNTHTTDSFTGQTMTGILHKAISNIKRCVGGNENNYVIPVGAGSTAAIVKLCQILGLYLTPGLKMNIDQMLLKLKCDKRYNDEIIKDIFKNMSETKPIIFISGYEHHSNFLIWKESFAEVVEIKLTKTGEFDYDDLELKLKEPRFQNRIKIGSFSAASNITGVKTDCYHVARLMHKYHGLVFFDFAASAPYVEINMNKDNEAYFDAIFISPHKFIGGPGGAGILVINKHLYNTLYPPTVAGGGTVQFVSPYCYHFINDVESRENAGTPGILQILKTSLALELKEYIGTDNIEIIEKSMLKKAFSTLKQEPSIEIYGPLNTEKRISILSFNIRHDDKYLHHKLVSQLLNDLFGIQSRAGCACAGPYAHYLLGINQEKSLNIDNAVKTMESLRPGFVRINFHYLMNDDEVEFILKAIIFIARYGYLFLSQYKINLVTGNWNHNYLLAYNPYIDTFGFLDALKPQDNIDKTINQKQEYDKYLNVAKTHAQNILTNFKPYYHKYNNLKYEALRWFNFINYE